MGLIFKDQLHDEFGTLPLAYIPYGGADFGEVAAVGLAVGDGDDSAFYDAWVGAAKRLAGEAQMLADRGRRASARELFFRACCFYGASYRPLFGRPVDPRLVVAFRKQIDAFNKKSRAVRPSGGAAAYPVRTQLVAGLSHSRRRL